MTFLANIIRKWDEEIKIKEDDIEEWERERRELGGKGDDNEDIWVEFEYEG